jgi:hypothetical protein
MRKKSSMLKVPLRFAAIAPLMLVAALVGCDEKNV